MIPSIRRQVKRTSVRKPMNFCIDTSAMWLNNGGVKPEHGLLKSNAIALQKPIALREERELDGACLRPWTDECHELPKWRDAHLRILPHESQLPFRT
jgi:hypothetical protein